MVKWTPKSEEDLGQILEHVALNFNVDLAIETVNEIIISVESILSQNPLEGSILESNPLFFKLVINGNSVFYCDHPISHDLYIVYVQGRYTEFKNQRISNKEIA